MEERKTTVAYGSPVAIRDGFHLGSDQYQGSIKNAVAMQCIHLRFGTVLISETAELQCYHFNCFTHVTFN